MELLLFFWGGRLNGVKMVRYPNISIDNSPRYMECRFWCSTLTNSWIVLVVAIIPPCLLYVTQKIYSQVKVLI